MPHDQTLAQVVDMLVRQCDNALESVTELRLRVRELEGRLAAVTEHPEARLAQFNMAMED